MNRLSFLAVSLAILLAAGAARASGDADAALIACRAETDDSRRLACYDRAMDRELAAVLPAAPRATPQAAPQAAPPAAPPTEAPTVLTAEEKFGREGAMAREETEQREQESRALGELQAKVTGIWTRSDGLMVVTLDNGQVWKQNRPEGFFRLKAGDTVKIQPAALGSFLMTGPSKRSTRVTRVR